MIDPRDCNVCDRSSVLKKTDRLCPHLAKDGLRLRCVPDHSETKLRILRAYIYIFSTGMKNLWPRRSYLDLFAGPGLCYNYQRRRETPGSPILALESHEPFTSIHLVELHKEIREILKERIRTYRPEGIKTKVLIYPGDCNRKIVQIRKRLPPDSLDLVFIDPEGFELHFQTIESLTERRRMDLIINFPTSGIRRNTRNMAAEEASLLDGLVPGWKQVYSKPFGTEKAAAQAILNHFKELLKGIGYIKIERGDQISVFSSGTRVHLYDLIFATKHPRGIDFWNKVARRASEGSQKTLF